MPLVAVTYVKGRPGATTTALGLAAVAPEWARPVVIECDQAGGDLVRRHELAAVPSVVDLAAAARGTADPREVFAAVAQPVTVREVTVPVVAAPAGGAQTRAALPELTGGGRAVLTAPDRVVVADCGRLGPGSPVWPLLRLADVVLVLVRATAADVAHLREHLGDLVDAGAGRLVVLLGAGGVYPAAEVADVLSAHVEQELARERRVVDVLGPLPDDPRAAAVLGGDLIAGRWWRRLPLMTAYAQLWDDLLPYLPTVTPQLAVEDVEEAS
ncbi:MinD/ParA family ATP-binding protein [Micromonospora zamorensis]|uniref:MinD/ParA family ATP-binding protein n=1 Tax=Micromonospora zamorensis TaxID=709883 RepID=UPI0033B97335